MPGNCRIKSGIPFHSNAFALLTSDYLPFSKTHGRNLGTSIQRILRASQNYDLPTPEFQIYDHMFRVNLFRRPPSIVNPTEIAKTPAKHGDGSVKFGNYSVKYTDKMPDNGSVKSDNPMLSSTQQNILSLIEKNHRTTALQIANVLAVSIRTVEKNIKKLRETGILKRYGSARSGYWEIIQ